MIGNGAKIMGRTKLPLQEKLEHLTLSQNKYNHSLKGIYKGIKHHKCRVLISQKDFIQWYLKQPKICYYCSLSEKQLKNVDDKFNNRFSRLTIDRKDSTKPYQIDNLVLCCNRCNMIKNDFFSEADMLEIGKKFIKPKWQPFTKRN